MTRARAGQIGATLLAAPAGEVRGATVVWRPSPPRAEVVAVITAGTADLPVAEECVATLGAYGLSPVRLNDVGVAGIHRLLDVLDDLVARLAPGSVDVLFFDAVKTEYPAYFKKARELIAVGGWLIADNVLGAGDWWIDDEEHPSRRAVAELSRALAADEAFEACCVPLREGVLLARRVR